MSTHGHLDARVSLVPHEALARDLIRERAASDRADRAPRATRATRATRADGRGAPRAARHPRAAGLLRRWADRLDPRPIDHLVHRVDQEPRPWAPVRRPPARRHG